MPTETHFWDDETRHSALLVNLFMLSLRSCLFIARAFLQALDLVLAEELGGGLAAPVVHVHVPPADDDDDGSDNNVDPDNNGDGDTDTNNGDNDDSDTNTNNGDNSDTDNDNNNDGDNGSLHDSQNNETIGSDHGTPDNGQGPYFVVAVDDKVGVFENCLLGSTQEHFVRGGVLESYWSREDAVDYYRRLKAYLVARSDYLRSRVVLYNARRNAIPAAVSPPGSGRSSPSDSVLAKYARFPGTIRKAEGQAPEEQEAVASGVVMSELPSGLSPSPPVTPEMLIMRARGNNEILSNSQERDSSTSL